MKLLDGKIPEGKKWRSLVLISPEHRPGLVWRFAMQLAKASNGEAVALQILPEAVSRDTLQKASETLTHAQTDAPADSIAHCLVVEAQDVHEALLEIVQKADIDLLLIDGDNLQWKEVGSLPCAIAVFRGAAYQGYGDSVEEATLDANQGTTTKKSLPIRRILVPTTAGPNSVVALSFLLPLAPEVDLTALYVVPNYLGPNEEAHARVRLRQLSNYADANEKLEKKVVQAESVIEGIVDEAGDYDLVIIGATRESSLDRALFGDVVGAVVRESKTPVAVVWEPASMLGNLSRRIGWRLQNIIPRPSLSKRTDVYVRIRRSARPSTSFFVLIGLSTLIAALGLLLSSPAVVIGAMLVAPIMSPIIGAGLAIVLGNPRFLRLSIGAIAKGVLLALLLSVVSGFIQTGGPLTPEILSRTEPTLLDLGVALFAGIAGAYALAHSDAAAALPGVAISAALVPPLAAVGIALSKGHLSESLGAMLLFTTNLIAIVAAAIIVFLVLGFRPSQERKAERAVQQRSVRVAMVLLATITVVLAGTTYRLATEARLDSRAHSIAETRVSEMRGVELANLEIEHLNNSSEPLTLHLTVRSTHAILHHQVEELRQQIGADLQPHLGENRQFAMTLTVIRVTILDPEIPPTATPDLEAAATLQPPLADSAMRRVQPTTAPSTPVLE